MTGEASLILFLTASLIVIVAPGPDNILVLTRGVTLGRGAALLSAAGASVGLVVHSTFAAVGLSALLRQSAFAFSAVKYVGAAYLIYLGVKALLDREGFDVSREAAPIGPRSIFFQAVISDVLNPKVALFFVAFLPQFVDPAAGGVAAQLLVLGLVFALVGLVIDGAIAYFSGSLGEWLGREARAANALRWLMGTVLVGLGLRLALPDRR